MTAPEPTDTGGIVPPTALPPLREELTLHEGPPADSGAPTWSLQDPVRNSYYRLDWLGFEVLSRWHLQQPEAIAAAVQGQTTLACDVADVAAVCKFLQDNELLLLEGQQGTAWYVQRQAQRQQSGWRWLLHHYLFFRLPLFQPDRWLERWLPLVAPLFGPTFRLATLVALGLGLIQAGRQWEQFSATLMDTFSWQGLLGYGVALSFVKILHELGHAFTAKRLGCRVPVMGVAFLVLWPLAYTDVNDVWKLKHRRQRLAVGAAGILTELTVAAWATLAWALLPLGVLRDMAFLLATTTWISTLVINASPFLRFDGYFLLADWLDMPNLHARAFALGRWRLREALFGLGDAPPEIFPPSRRRWLIVFAFATWLYRLVVFLGIAVLVYHFVIKALGIFLAIIELLWFIVLPVWRELAAWWRDTTRIRQSRRARLGLVGVVMLLALTVLPLRFQLQAQGLLRPMQSFLVVAPVAAQVAALPIQTGQRLRVGDLLVQLEATEPQVRHLKARQNVLFADWQLAAASVSALERPRLPVLRQELAAAQAEAAAAQSELDKLANLAPFDGVVVDLSPELQPGDWVQRHEPIASLIDPASWRVDAYFTDEQIERLHIGDHGRFFPETPGAAVLDLQVERIDRDASRALPERLLAAAHGGTVLARDSHGTLVPERAIYKVSLRVSTAQSTPNVLVGERRGQVVVYGQATALLEDFARTLATLLVRESGF
ncbi:HlyD family efflux transporter periplasmic adaptor subunit [Rhodoferax sp.]|uniref:HlyD family efflux transporter periplasmic adaptor subunit n=1 Tax=Rhodoferax sp. TaxID=50421 RepID=UPI002722323B|nr:HlyD family efflux transporter periplasmic adaptor subunit [Rhodoferax sp.]MDO8318064.1 HlyD family efflux transporter periplasmic adaptor subunit [Rhodoferax sp.]